MDWLVFVTNPGWKIPKAAEALERPAASPEAQRYRTAAVYFFLAMAVLTLSAAIVFVVAGPVFASDVLGWSGVACFHLCLFCGLRYGALNRRAESEELRQDVNPPGSARSAGEFKLTDGPKSGR
jgi:hypothetical protein